MQARFSHRFRRVSDECITRAKPEKNVFDATCCTVWQNVRARGLYYTHCGHYTASSEWPDNAIRGTGK